MTPRERRVRPTPDATGDLPALLCEVIPSVNERLPLPARWYGDSLRR